MSVTVDFPRKCYRYNERKSVGVGEIYWAKVVLIRLNRAKWHLRLLRMSKSFSGRDTLSAN